MPLFAKFLQESLRTVGDFPVSAVSLVLEPFFAKVVASEDKDTRAAGVLALAVLSTQIQGLLSSLLVPGSSLLESLVDEAIPRAVQDFASPTFSQILAMQCLNHVLHEVAALPPPIAILDSLITLLRPSSQWIAAILSSLTPAVQIYLFTMLHTFVTLPSCEFSIDLQQFAIDTGLFLRILRCALFDASSFQRIIARCLVVLLCYQNESAALFLRRCFPKTLIDSLNKGTFEYSFATLLKSNEPNEPNEPKESFSPLQKAVWSAVIRINPIFIMMPVAAFMMEPCKGIAFLLPFGVIGTLIALIIMRSNQKFSRRIFGQIVQQALRIQTETKAVPGD